MRALSLISLTLLLACGGDESALHSTIELEFRVRGQDVDGDGTVVDQADVDFAEGASWRSFADRIATEQGTVPETLTVTSVQLTLLDSSQGVQDLGDVFNGPIALRFRTGGNQNEYSLAVADVRAASEATVVSDFLIEFNYGLIGDSDRERIFDGPLQVIFVGQAGEDFRDGGRVAEFSARLDFAATPPAAPAP